MKLLLHKLTAEIGKDIPVEFPRKMRSTVYYGKYKAVDFKFFLLYVAPIMLQNIMNDDAFDHLMLLVVGCRLMFSTNWMENTTQARKFFTEFVNLAKDFYGKSFLSINVHNLCHIVDDAENMHCSLSDITAFEFESYLGKISSRLRSPKNIVKQYCKRQWELENYARKKAVEEPKLLILKEVKKYLKSYAKKKIKK